MLIGLQQMQGEAEERGITSSSGEQEADGHE